MASLKGSTIASSYKSLLKLNGNTDTLVAGNGSNAIQIVHSDDSTGVTSPLYLNTDRVGIGAQPETPLHVNGSIFAGSSGHPGVGYSNVLNNFNSYIGLQLKRTGAGTSDFFRAVDSSDATKFYINSDGGIFSASNVGIKCTPSQDFEIKFATDKHMLFSDSQGETGTCPTIHTTNTAGDALVEFGVRASEIRLATGSAKRMVLDDNSRISLSNNDLGTSNTVFGYEAGNLIGSGDNYNVFIGHQVADADMTDAIQNVGIGYQALTSLTTGVSNTAIGSGSLYSLNTGNYNVSMGHLSADALTSSQYNVAIGYGSLGAEITSGTAIAIGFEALGLQNKGDANNSENVGVGFQAGLRNVTGTSNTSVGFEAMKGASGQSNSNNTAVGAQAMLSITTGSNNVAMGHLSSDAITSGSANTAIGVSSLGANTATHNNVAVGTSVLQSLEASSQNTALGSSAMSSIGTNASGLANCVAVGYQAFQGGTSTTTDANGTVAIGMNSLHALTSGAGNIAVGYTALSSCTSGGSNVAIGDTALEDLVTGGANVAIGRNAGKEMGAGENGNILIGMAAGQSLDEGTSGLIDSNIAIGKDCFTGGNLNTASTVIKGNIAIGTDALNSTGTNAQTGTIAIGHNSLTALTTGVSNVAVGFQTGDGLTDGGNNVLIGYNANSAGGASASQNVGIGVNALLNATGSNNTAVGYNAGDVTEGATLSTFIGYNADGSGANINNETVIGGNATGQGANSVTLGNADVTAVYMAQDSGASVYADAIGLGTTSIDHKLQIRGTSINHIELSDGNSSAYGIAFSRDSAPTARIGMTEPGAVGTGALIFLTSPDNGYSLAEHFRINSNGDLTATDTTIGSNSDERLKKNIVDYTGGLDIVKELRPVQFQYKDSNRRQGNIRGFIAQEVKLVDDYYVSEQNIPEQLEDGKDNSEYQYVADTNGTSLISKITEKDTMYVSAIKELLVKVETLEAKVEELEKK